MMEAPALPNHFLMQQRRTAARPSKRESASRSRPDDYRLNPARIRLASIARSSRAAAGLAARLAQIKFALAAAKKSE